MSTEDADTDATDDVAVPEDASVDAIVDAKPDKPSLPFPDVADPACHAVQQSPIRVVAMNTTKPTPAVTGGVIPDGLYYATAMTTYDWFSNGPDPNYTESYEAKLIQGSTMRMVINRDYGQVERRFIDGFTISGTTIHIKRTCPSDAVLDQTLPYSVVGNDLLIFFGANTVRTYTKQ